MSSYPSKISVTEVGPRDGLQNQSLQVSTVKKIEWVNALSLTGLQTIETSAFVSAKWVPQLSDAKEVFGGIRRQQGVRYTALVPNEIGFEQAKLVHPDGVAVITAASETFCEKNTNTSIEGSMNRIVPVIHSAKSSGIDVRCYISCVVACPYEGAVRIEQVRDIAKRLLDEGVDTIDLGETIGVAEPDDILRLYDGLSGVLEPEESVLHLHNTNGKALDCADAAMKCGVVRFDSSSGGLGGCPYAPGAAGNLATEDLVKFASDRGVETGIDLDALVKATSIIEQELQCTLPSATYQTRKAKQD